MTDNTDIKTTTTDKLDEWRTEVTYKADTLAGPYKATDMHGGNGVICRVLDDDELPVDDSEPTAEVIIYDPRFAKP